MIIIRAEAKRDLREAKSWYQNISPELKRDFVRRVGEAITLAQARLLAFQLVHRTFRRILIHRFPYALFYHAADNRIVAADARIHLRHLYPRLHG